MTELVDARPVSYFFFSVPSGRTSLSFCHQALRTMIKRARRMSCCRAICLCGLRINILKLFILRVLIVEWQVLCAVPVCDRLMIFCAVRVLDEYPMESKPLGPSGHEWPTGGTIASLLEKCLPGTSEATRLLREQILQFCSDPTARIVLLRGSIGVGKSTIARLIGFLKRIAPLSVAGAEQLIRDLRFDGPGRIDGKLMPWYVELSLTGVVETLADTQLFGIERRTATGVEARAGVFEAAQRGSGPDDRGASVTGGVVFLDEIAELPKHLQAKLLSVLSGGAFTRVGREATPAAFKRYQGITIAASWRHVEGGAIRADLLSRLSDNVIWVPSIRERGEDLIPIIGSVQSDLIQGYKNWLSEICVAEPKVDRGYWEKKAEELQPVADEVAQLLSTVDWDSYGNLRGLTQALRKIVIRRRDPKEVISGLQRVPLDRLGGTVSPEELLNKLLTRKPDRAGLAGHLRAVEVEQRRALRDLLVSDISARRVLAQALDIDEEKLLYQIQQMDRSRRRTRRGGFG